MIIFFHLPYDQLADIVELSSRNGHNVCVRTSKDQIYPIIYRDWTSWLSKYFLTLNGISNYHHFRIEKNDPSNIFVKELKDSKEVKVELTKNRSHLVPLGLQKDYQNNCSPEVYQ